MKEQIPVCQVQIIAYAQYTRRTQLLICFSYGPSSNLQYLNQLENCCGLQERAILILLSDIGKCPEVASGSGR